MFLTTNYTHGVSLTMSIAAAAAVAAYGFTSNDVTCSPTSKRCQCADGFRTVDISCRRRQ